MPTEKETLYIAFSTQKGGAGKTTLTVLAASYLHYVKGLNVAVVDCDYPQHSIAEMRKRDLKTVMEDEHYKAMAYRQLQRIGKKAYPVVEGTAEDAVEKAEGLLEKLPGTDIVFFDLPGTVNSGGVLRTLANIRFPHRWGKALSGKADDNQTESLRPRRRIHAAKVGSITGCRTTPRPATLCHRTATLPKG